MHYVFVLSRFAKILRHRYEIKGAVCKTLRDVLAEIQDIILIVMF